MKDDPEVKAGWGPINLNWLFRGWAWGVVEWHDRITEARSFAARACIPGKRIAEHWWDMLRYAAKKTPSRVDDVIAEVAGAPMELLQPPFYEGPETEEEAAECRKRLENSAHKVGSTES